MKAPHHFVEEHYPTWPALERRLRSFAVDSIFRGQRDADWPLATTLERSVHPSFFQYAEAETLRLFRAGVHNFLGVESLPQTTLECLVLMQHHGASTRLLDWTKSPYVAAYFACEEADKPPHGRLKRERASRRAIWKVSIAELNIQVIEAVHKGIPSYRGFEGIEQDVFRDPNAVQAQDMLAPLAEDFDELFRDHSLDLVAAIRPPKGSQRLANQQAFHLCPGNVDHTLMQNLIHLEESRLFDDAFVKITFPAKLPSKILDDLRLMNVDRRTLFPGLDGFAQSIRLQASLRFPCVTND